MKKRLRAGKENDIRRVVLLSLFFLAGIILGAATAKLIPPEDMQLLRELVISRGEAVSLQPEKTGLLPVLWVYSRGMILLMVLHSCHRALVPVLVLCTAKAAGLSFSMCAFAGAMGHHGLLIALAMLGFRCLFCLPTTLFLADSLIKGWWSADTAQRVSFWQRVLIAGAMLLTGALLEWIVSPRLLALCF